MCIGKRNGREEYGRILKMQHSFGICYFINYKEVVVGLQILRSSVGGGIMQRCTIGCWSWPGNRLPDACIVYIGNYLEREARKSDCYPSEEGAFRSVLLTTKVQLQMHYFTETTHWLNLWENPSMQFSSRDRHCDCACFACLAVPPPTGIGPKKFSSWGLHNFIAG